MDFKIENGPVFTTLRIQMAKGESFRAEAGAMIAMSPTIQLEAKSSGKGFFGTLKAAVGGEDLFASLFTAVDGDGELLLAPSSPGDIVKFEISGKTLLLAPSSPGDIVKFEISGKTLYAQAGSYLAGSPELTLSTEGSLKAMVSGEGLFLQKISGSGTVFHNSYGAIIEKKLAAGESYIVDTGHIVAFDDTVKYQIKKVAKGFFSSIASGEGLVCQYQGPGSLWMQTRNLPAFAQLIEKFLPESDQ